MVGGRTWWWRRQGGEREREWGGGSGSECSASGRHTFQPDDSLAISLHLAGRPHAAALGADARVPPTRGFHEWPGCVSVPSWADSWHFLMSRMPLCSLSLTTLCQQMINVRGKFPGS